MAKPEDLHLSLDPATYVEGLRAELVFARDAKHKAEIQSEIDRVSKATTVKDRETR